MKWTRATAEEHAENVGYEPVQIDGIPEGFSYVWRGLKIGSKVIPDRYVAFVPLANLELSANDIETLLQEYNLTIKNRNVK